MINITRNKRQFHAKIIRQHVVLESFFMQKIIPILNKQWRASASVIQDGVTNFGNEVDKYFGDMRKEFENFYNKIGRIYFNEVNDRLEELKGITAIPLTKDSENIFQQFFSNWLVKEAVKEVTLINITTENILRRIMKRSIENGLTYGQTAKEIRDLSVITNPVRSKAIARTEMHTAYGQAVDQSIRSTSTPIQEKEWLTALDERSRDKHIIADGETVSMNARFLRTGESLDYPGDPAGSGWNIINCRCITLYNTRS